MKFLIPILLVCISGCYSATLVTLSSTCISQFNTGVLTAHNNYRAMHSAPALITNTTIVNIAQNYANYLGTNDLFQHSYTSGLGENLAYSWSSSAPSLTNCTVFATKFVKMWYDEISMYNFSNPGFSSGTGHFTQVVWVGSKQLGCGLSVNNLNKVYGVCNYSPPGNYLNQFATNVKPLVQG